MTDPSSSDRPEPTEALDSVYADYLARIDAGEAVDREALLRAHPDLAAELESVFDAADLVDGLAGPVVGSTSAERGEVVEAVGPPLPCEFGEYELLEVIGSGGMGIVYRARQRSVGRDVAIKVLRAGSFASETDLRRFAVEARAAGGLEHPNIINVHQVGEIGGQSYFSMDYVASGDLAQLCRAEPLPPRVAAQIVRAVGDAIDSAHEAGVLHRDIKPANIIVDGEGRPIVTDFGLAKHFEDESNLTTTGTAIGTPSYMAPEAATGAEVDRRSDVYSLGAVLYELVAGCPPFRGRTPMETVLKVLHEDAPEPGRVRPEADAALAAIAVKCLEKDPELRYPTARALVADLDRYLAGRAPLARPVGAVRRALRWCREIPIVAAATGARHGRASLAQHLVQWLAVLAVGLVGLRWIAGGGASQLPLPTEVRIAAAVPGGEYHRFSEGLAPELGALLERGAVVLATEGSEQNRELLLSGQADLALIQASAVRSDGVAVIAPLYYDLVHVVVRRASAATTVRDLAGRRVSIGLEASGMRTSAVRLLDHFGLGVADLEAPSEHFTILLEDPSYEAAIITTGRQNGDLLDLLATGDFRLLSLAAADRDALVGPTFRSLTLPDGAYPGLPEGAVPTIATTTFLATVPRAADGLVTATLEALYASPLVEELDLLTADEALEWQMLDLHPAADAFYEAVRLGRR